jgi:acyl carrier protein
VIGDIKSADAAKRRAYRTGDLVKYASDGSLIFCGRKDTQAKLHGQRLEMSEVEFHLTTDSAVQHSFVTIPKTGFCKNRLVAVLSLQELTATNSKSISGSLDVVVREASAFHTSAIRDRLCGLLPAYMIPSNWVIVQKLPLLSSGKLDRKRIEKWVADMTTEVYHQISDIADEEASEGSILEQQLQKIWATTLNLPPEQIGLNKSFLFLGGDSISAMQVMSSCRAEGLGITVQDLIQWYVFMKKSFHHNCKLDILM